MLRCSRFILSAGLAVILTWANGAFAHAHLQAADPAPKAELHASPQVVRVEFSEPVEPKFSRVVVRDAAGQGVQTGRLARDPKNAKVMLLPLGAALKPGTYQVEWLAVATDTHKTRGTYTFTVK